MRPTIATLSYNQVEVSTLSAKYPLPFDPIQHAHDNWRRNGWHHAADGMAFVTSIMRVQQLLLARVDAILAPWGLTFSRYEVLRLLAFSQGGQLPVGKIGERLQVHPASVTNAVKRLEHDGLVERSPNPRDGRGVLAEITSAGRSLVDACTQRLNDDYFSTLPPAERDQREVFRILRALRRAMGDFD